MQTLKQYWKHSQAEQDLLPLPRSGRAWETRENSSSASKATMIMLTGAQRPQVRTRPDDAAPAPAPLLAEDDTEAPRAEVGLPLV